MAGVTLTQPDGQQTQSSENPFGLVGYAWA
jgi:hypothetical protein